MELTVGTILEGKVKSITKFGAFVSLPDNRTGMVHISEIAHAYVSDIHDHLTEGQEVRVMIIAVDPAGKINLSIKRTLDPPARQQSDRAAPRQQAGRPGPDRGRPAPPHPAQPRPAPARENPSFDDMVKQFLQDSDSKISSLKQYSDHRKRRR